MGVFQIPFRTCSRVILSLDWQNLSDEDCVKESFIACVRRCQSKLETYGHAKSGVLNHLVDTQWTEPMLTKIMACGDEEIDKDEGDWKFVIGIVSWFPNVRTAFTRQRTIWIICRIVVVTNMNAFWYAHCKLPWNDRTVHENANLFVYLHCCAVLSAVSNYLFNEDPDILRLRLTLLMENGCDEFALNLSSWLIKMSVFSQDIDILLKYLILLIRQDQRDQFHKKVSFCSHTLVVLTYGLGLLVLRIHCVFSRLRAKTTSLATSLHSVHCSSSLFLLSSSVQNDIMIYSNILNFVRKCGQRREWINYQIELALTHWLR